MGQDTDGLISRRTFAGGLVAGIVITGIAGRAWAARKASDLIITSLRWSTDGITFGNARVEESSNVLFEAVVKNQGRASTPPGVVIGVAFYLDGNLTVWSDTYKAGLAAGKSVTLRANDYWFDASLGTYAVRGHVDYKNLIPGETNESNNTRTVAMMVSAIVGGGGSDTKPWSNGNLRVSSNGRHLQHTNGTPFLWVGDTNWNGIYRMPLAEQASYFKNRDAKGINVVLAVVTGVDEATYGDLVVNGSTNLVNSGVVPFTSQNPATPNETYFQQVDHYIAKAAQYGVYVALLPTWGTRVCNSGNPNVSIIFNTTNAATYGTWIANRYKNTPNIIWVVGGDKAPNTCTNDVNIWRAFGNAINDEDPNHVIIYHPNAAGHSYTLLHNDSWMDMNGEQSWSNIDTIIADITGAYGQSPAKPVVNLEAAYEHGTFWGDKTAVEKRLQPYYTMLAGGAGYVYGNFYLWATALGEAASNNDFWYNHLDDSHAVETAVWARMWRSMRWWRLAPDQGAISGGTGSGTSQTRAAVSLDGDFLVVYYPTNTARTIVKTKITTSANAAAKWMRPTNLSESVIGTVSTSGTQSFTPPAGWADAVLLLEAI